MYFDIFNNNFQLFIKNLLDISQFLHNHFDGMLSIGELENPVSDFLKERTVPENSDQSSDEEKDLLNIFSNSQLNKFKGLLKVFKMSCKDLAKTIKKMDEKSAGKYGLDKLLGHLPEKNQMKSNSFPMSALIFSDEKGNLGNMKNCLEILCGLQNSLISEYESVFEREKEQKQTEWADLDCFNKQDVLYVSENDITDIVKDFVLTRVETNKRPEYKYKMDSLSFNILRSLFLAKKRLKTANLKKFRFKNKIYGTKDFLPKLIDTYGEDLTLQLMKFKFKERFVSQASDLIEFEKLNRLIFYMTNQSEADPDESIRHFLERQKLRLHELEDLSDKSLRTVYQYYCLLESRLIKINFYQVDIKFKNFDMDEKSCRKLQKFFSNFEDKKISKKIPIIMKNTNKLKLKKMEMSYLEFWLISLVRYISRYLSSELDEDHLIGNNMKQCDHLYPEQLDDAQQFPDQKKFEDKLCQLKIKNKFVLEVFELLEKICIKNFI